MVLFLYSRVIMSVLLLGIVLSVRNGWFHSVVNLPSRLVSTVFGMWLYQCSLCNFTPVSLHMLKCRWAHTLSCFFT
jgi:ABC-type xylose transport system permease subunit